MELLSENKIHQTILRLNKEKARELELRKYLDNCSKNGISRKEAIIRMYEVLENNGFIEDYKLKLVKE